MPQIVFALTIPSWLEQGIAAFGYWAIFVAVSLESLGVPFPGETSLLAGSIYAATTGRISITLVIVAAAAGAIIGDNIGYTIGYFGGYPLLRTILRTFHIPESRARFAQDYFARHGDKTVFLGRFFSLLRIWVALLAGINHMPRRSFLFWNAVGGIVWATVYGVLGYILGHNVAELDRVLAVMGAGGVAAVVAAIAVLIVLWLVRRRREREKLDRAAAGALEPLEESRSEASIRAARDTQDALDAADTVTRG